MNLLDVFVGSDCSTNLASEDVNPMSEQEVSPPEEIDQGGPGGIGKYLRQH